MLFSVLRKTVEWSTSYDEQLVIHFIQLNGETTHFLVSSLMMYKTYHWSSRLSLCVPSLDLANHPLMLSAQICKRAPPMGNEQSSTPMLSSRCDVSDQRALLSNK